jgi:hypothetical protein
MSCWSEWGRTMPSNPKRPRDPNQLAKSIIDIATGSEPSPKPPEKVSRSKGGKARADSLSAERRSEIAKKAAESRWAGRK